MEIIERTVDGITILDLSGKLTIGEGAQLLKDKSEELVFQGCNRVIVNLAAVPYIDSGGLGQLVAGTIPRLPRPAAGSSSSTWARRTTTCCRSPSSCRFSTRSTPSGKRSRATRPRPQPELLSDLERFAREQDAALDITNAEYVLKVVRAKDEPKKDLNNELKTEKKAAAKPAPPRQGGGG